MTIPVKTQTARQYLDIYAIELETISELSRKAQVRGLKNWLSDVNRKVNFRSSQVEAFIDRKVSNQFLIILNAKIFILNRKMWPAVHFISSNVVGLNFVKKPHVNLEDGLEIDRSRALKQAQVQNILCSAPLDKLELSH